MVNKIDRSLSFPAYDFKYVVLLCSLLLYSGLEGQLSLTYTDLGAVNERHIVERMFMGDAAEVINVSKIGSYESIALFHGAQDVIGLKRGILLSTGKAADANVPNESGSTGSTPDKDAAVVDADLQTMTSTDIKESTGLEFRLKLYTDTFEMRYVFASEEYPEWICSEFNDVFAIFISGENPNGGMYDRVNIALVPELDDPSGKTFTNYPVRTNTVNSGVVHYNECTGANESIDFSEYYNDNTGGQAIAFDGFLDAFKARIPVVSCSEYVIKVVIGDANDFDFDSAVFLEGGHMQGASDIPAAPRALQCEEIDRDHLRFTWGHDENIDFEIDTGSGWVKKGSATQFDILNIAPETTVDFRVRAVRGQCVSEVAELSCSTPSCIEPQVQIVTLVNSTNACTANGKVQLRSSNTKEPYQLEWNGQRYESDQIEGLPVGTHDITLIDGYGCSGTLSVTIAGPEPLKVGYTKADAYCGFSGYIDAFVTGGVGPYSFEWAHGPSDKEVNGLAAGEYILSVTDAMMCQMVETIRIYDSPEMEIRMISAVDVVCAGDSTGSITLDHSKTIAPYTYSVQYDDGRSYDRLRDLPAGDAMVTVTDSVGCKASATVKISDAKELVISMMSTDSECAWSHNGSAEVSVSGGQSPYTYQWSNGMQTKVIEGIAGGIYSVVVSDANGCTARSQVQVSNREPISMTVIQENNTCNGESTGRIEFSFSTDVSVSWTDGGTERVRAGLTAGTYCAKLTTPMGCAIDTCIVITEPAAMQVDITTTDNQCYQTNDGQVAITVSNSKGPYRLNYADRTNTFQHSYTLKDLAPGRNDFIVSDSMGCSTSHAVEIAPADPVIFSFSTTDVNCTNGTDGSIDVSISGVNAVEDFTWTGRNEYSSNRQRIDGLSAGVYALGIVTDKGCIYADSTVVREPEDGIMAQLIVDSISCHGESDASIEIRAEGGTGLHRYSIDGGRTYSDRFLYAGLSSGEYPIHVADESDCIVMLDTITFSEPEEFSVKIVAPTEAYEGQDVPVAVSTLGGRDYTLVWMSEPNELLPCMACDSATISMIYHTVYLSVDAVTSSGCTATSDAKILIRRPNHIAVPTAFSPNGDGANDLLTVFGTTGARVIEFSVFDSRGGLIFYKRDFDVNQPQIGWDGSYKGKQMNQGVYIWRATAIFPDGQQRNYNGVTQLMN